LTGIVATLVTALVTKIQQEAHSDFTPEIAPFTYSGPSYAQIRVGSDAEKP
jgi:hypothetical protein